MIDSLKMQDIIQICTRHQYSARSEAVLRLNRESEPETGEEETRGKP
jgi:hypothetical protein